MPHKQYILEMRGIRKRFGATLALDGVDVRVQSGEVLALVGENGAGKSTLMKVLSGVIQPDAGEMLLAGASYTPRHPHEARTAGVAMVYQELSLAPHLSVAENILLGMEPARWGFLQRTGMHRLASEALVQLGHSDIRPDASVRSLSIAECQLVEIARALAVGCRVLVLDEPTSSLTGSDIERLFELVRRLKKQGNAVIYISHVLEEVKQISDRFIVLRDGKTVGEGRTKSTSAKKIVAMMVGREVDDFYPCSKRKTGDVVLAIQNVAGVIKPVSATFKLHRGEVLGIAGLIGAGRSELMRMIFGLDAVRRGEVRVGTYFGPASPVLRWKQGMGMVSEDRKNEGLAVSLSVSDNLTLSRLDGFGLFGTVLPSRQDQAALTWVQRLNIKLQNLRQAVGSLSGGNQQKVAIARLLHHDVDVFLLDEPTRGIDVGSKAEIYKLIDELASRGKAILLVSSYLPELLGVCDRIAMMRRGELNPARPVRQVNEHTLMMEATGAE
ncbi:MAG: sugar ABC transporter ATP-binding protein [Ignavibacteriae bacterium]|nr:sugar ABC transporter ATP-binding protein [Ignavibacteriota bacterium]